MKKFFLIIVVVFFLVGCSAETYKVSKIVIKGSDTMLPLTEMLAEEYMRNNPGVSIYVEGGGTTSGVRALIRGEVDISTASRSLKAEEAKMLADYYGSLGMYYLVAKDALSIYLNPENPVVNLSIKQLKKIYTCEITNWQEVGGNDQKILPIIRPPNSGTHQYFLEHVLEGETYCEDVKIEPTTKSVIEVIDENPNAIGYGGIGYKEDIIHAKINNIEASEENARNDKYPITRYLHFFTSRSPSGSVKSFIDWVLTPEGQKVIDEAGYIPLWEVSY
jgi:phosphate transport system substrate-binding protein